MQTKKYLCYHILKQVNLEASKVADNKKFWKIVKNIFSDKSNNFETTTIVENNIVISDNREIADNFIEYFCTIVLI